MYGFTSPFAYAPSFLCASWVAYLRSFDSFWFALCKLKGWRNLALAFVVIGQYIRTQNCFFVIVLEPFTLSTWDFDQSCCCQGADPGGSTCWKKPFGCGKGANQWKDLWDLHQIQPCLWAVQSWSHDGWENCCLQRGMRHGVFQSIVFCAITMSYFKDLMCLIEARTMLWSFGSLMFTGLLKIFFNGNHQS